VAISTELILNASQQDELVAISQSRSLPAGYVFRAKLILMLAEGATFRTIKHKLGTTAPTIVRCICWGSAVLLMTYLIL
jgi:hypothetical protein